MFLLTKRVASPRAQRPVGAARRAQRLRTRGDAALAARGKKSCSLAAMYGPASRYYPPLRFVITPFVVWAPDVTWAESDEVASVRLLSPSSTSPRCPCSLVPSRAGR